MTRLLLSLVLLLSFSVGFCRDTLYIQSHITVNAGDTLYIRGNLISESQTLLGIRNAGEIHLTGDLINRYAGLFYLSTNGHANFDSIPEPGRIPVSRLYRSGAVHFVGADTQRIIVDTGAEIFFSDIYIHNHVVLNGDIRVQGKLTLHRDLHLNGRDLKLYAKDTNSTITDVFLQWGATGTIVGESDTSKITGDGKVIAIKGTNDACISQLSYLGFELYFSGDTMPVMLIRENRALPNVSDGSIDRTFRLLTNNTFSSRKQIDSVALHYLHKNFSDSVRNSADFAVWVRDDSLELPRRLTSVVDTSQRIVKGTAYSNMFVRTDTLFFTLANNECKAFRPMLSLGGDTIACYGETITLRNIHRADVVLHTWNSIAGNNITHRHGDSLDVEQTDTIILHIQTNRGCEESDTIRVQFHPNPSPQILINNQVPNNINTFKCVGDTFWLKYQELNDSLLARTDIRDIIWSFGDGTINSLGHDSISHFYTLGHQETNLNRTIRLSVTSNHGCRGDASVDITVDNTPLPVIEPYTPTNCNSNFCRAFRATCTRGMLQDDVGIAWFVDGNSVSTLGTSDILNFDFGGFGTYSVGLKMTTQRAFCKSDTAIFSVVIRDRADVSFRLDTNVFCAGETIRLVNTTQVYSDEDRDRIQYRVDLGDGHPAMSFSGDTVLSIWEAGIHTITLIANIPGTNWIGEYPKTIRINPNPVIGFGPEIRTCLSVMPLKRWNTGIDYRYLWCDGSTDSSLTVVQDGQYTLTLTNVHECVATESVAVFLNTTISTGLPRDTTHCGPLTLSVNYLSANYEWSTGETTRDIRIETAGTRTYWVTLTDSTLTDSICIVTDTIEVTILKIPSLDFEHDNIAICPGETITLSVPAQDSVSYQWITNYERTHTGPTITTSHRGTYWLTATHQNRCENTARVVVTVKNIPSLNLSGNTFLVCDTLPIDFNLGEANLVEWTFPDGSKTQGHLLSTSQTGMHKVFVEHANGCRVIDNINIQIGNTEIVADFLLASNVLQGDSVKFVNLSYHPRNTELQYLWRISDGFSTFTTTQKNPYVRFGRDGEYVVRLTIYSEGGNCPAVIEKTIIVASGIVNVFGINIDDEDSDNVPTDHLVRFLEAKLYPNPNEGNFFVRVVLSTEANVYALFADQSGRVLDRRVFRNQSEYILEYRFGHLQAGTYFLRLWSGREIRDFKIVVTN